MRTEFSTSANQHHSPSRVHNVCFTNNNQPATEFTTSVPIKSQSSQHLSITSMKYINALTNRDEFTTTIKFTVTPYWEDPRRTPQWVDKRTSYGPPHTSSRRGRTCTETTDTAFRHSRRSRWPLSSDFGPVLVCPPLQRRGILFGHPWGHWETSWSGLVQLPEVSTLKGRKLLPKAAVIGPPPVIPLCPCQQLG